MATFANGDAERCILPRTRRNVSALSLSTHPSKPYASARSEPNTTSTQQSSPQEGASTSAAISTKSPRSINSPQEKSSAKKIFRRLAKQYLESHIPPTKSDVSKLTDLKAAYVWRDIIEWRDEMGIKRGITFDEDGSIIFEEWPDMPHDQIIGVFSVMFTSQFVSPYQNQAAIDPVFEVDGTTDMWLPGKCKQPDQAFRPYPRAANLAMAALIRMQPVLGRPWPTIILEVGNSQGATQLVDIRDRALGWKTQINVFVGIAYNRNQTRATDSWWACVAVRDINANPPAADSPNTYPLCQVLYETAKVNNLYPKVDTPLIGNTIWSVPTALLYHPEPVPVLNPPLPVSFDFDVDRIRRAIERNRNP